MFTTTELESIIARVTSAVVAELATEAPAKAEPKARKARQPKAAVVEYSAAATHNREARLARRNDPANASSAKGLTKAEKSYLFHTFDDYAAAVTAYKALGSDDQARVLAGGSQLDA